GLVEQVEAVGSVVVRGQRHAGPGRISSARHEVLIAAVVTAEERAIAQVPAIALLFHGDRAEVHQRAYAAEIGIAVEGVERHVGRLALEGCNSAIGATMIAEMFVADRDASTRRGSKGKSRIDAGTLQVPEIAEGPRIFVHAIDAHRDFAAERLIQIRGNTLV